jgi:hypothetical protein
MGRKRARMPQVRSRTSFDGLVWGKAFWRRVPGWVFVPLGAGGGRGRRLWGWARCEGRCGDGLAAREGRSGAVRRRTHGTRIRLWGRCGRSGRSGGFGVVAALRTAGRTDNGRNRRRSPSGMTTKRATAGKRLVVCCRKRGPLRRGWRMDGAPGPCFRVLVIDGYLDLGLRSQALVLRSGEGGGRISGSGNGGGGMFHVEHLGVGQADSACLSAGSFCCRA